MGIVGPVGANQETTGLATATSRQTKQAAGGGCPLHFLSWAHTGLNVGA